MTGRNRAGEPLRVVQWTTGNVGRQSVLAVLANPGLELVGCLAWGAEKVGRDVGELCGFDPIGLPATDDVDAVLALDPDCVIYNPKWNDVDQLVRILESGVNVVSTVHFITGRALGADRDRIADACERGGSSIFGSGINPGFANLLGIVVSGLCSRIDKVSVLESVDSSMYDSPETDQATGMGLPIDTPDLPSVTAAGTAVFGDAVELTADALGVELDVIRCVAEYASATDDVDLGSWTIPKGHVAGIRASWQGLVADDVVIELNVCWRKGPSIEPDWRIEHGYVIEVVGVPSIRTKLEIWPPPDFAAESMADFMGLGMIATSLPAVNAIPRVCAADPGIVTYTDLPLILPRGWTRQGDTA